MTSDPLVTMKHVRTAKICSRGTREWFRSQGMSFSDFCTNGIRASVVEATGCPIAGRAAAVARAEAEPGNG